MKLILYTRYFLRSVRLRGFLETLRLLANEPAFEKSLGISTTGYFPPPGSDYYHYQGAAYRPLMRILRMIKEKDHAFFDIGSGKGRVALAAAHAGFSSITGIEMAEELVTQARTNAASFLSRKPGASVSFVRQDALEFEYPDVPAVFFLFNPFGEKVLDTFLRRKILPRKSHTLIIYMNPLYARALSKAGLTEKTRVMTQRYTEAIIYEHQAGT